jgi:hypothetical protein
VRFHERADRKGEERGGVKAAAQRVVS